MKWKGRRQSSNIEDRRGRRVVGGAGIGIGGIVMALIAIFVFKQDPVQVISSTLVQSQSGGGQVESVPYEPSPEEREISEFIGVVLADTEDTWGEVFRQAGHTYPPPTLVLYKDRTPTACGTGQAASGPFYCPGDQKIYLDLSFLNELKNMGASGQFAVAYVLAHEVGHHIQTITGTSEKVHRAKRAAPSPAEANGIQVRMELQADCYAGIWANLTHQRLQILEEGDLEEAIRAAAAIGDDAIMRRAGMPPRREAFTHGSSEERMDWFQRGARSGNLERCNNGI